MLKENKEQALLEIYKLYFNDLYNYGLRVARNEEIVRDSIHDLFVQLWSRDTYPHVLNPKPYLLKALRYTIIDALKKSKRDPASMEIEGIDLSQEDIMVNKEISEETSAKIKAAITGLSARQKEVIYLRFYGGLNYNEIAEVIGINNQSVRNLFSSSLKELRKQMIPVLLISTVLAI